MNGDKIMDYVYHGSKIQGLKKLEKRSSTHQQEWVYATPSKAVATIFINNGGSDFFYSLGGIGTTENPVVLVERKEGMFDKIFNLSGSLYTLKGDNFESGKTGWKAEVVSEFEEAENGCAYGGPKCYRYSEKIKKLMQIFNLGRIPWELKNRFFTTGQQLEDTTKL